MNRPSSRNTDNIRQQPVVPVHALNRRRLVQAATGLGAAYWATRPNLGMAQSPVSVQSTTLNAAARRQDVDPTKSDHTWLIDSPSAHRPEPPSAPTDEEIAELIQLQDARTDQTMADIQKWGSGQAVLPWLNLEMGLSTSVFPPGLLETRAQSLVRTAMCDAVVASLDAQAAFERPAPYAFDDRITVVGKVTTGTSTYPSMHAAVAGAASTVFGFLYPDESEDGFAGMANDAAESRLSAGANYRSDIDAGLALGRSIGELAIAYATADGSDAVWSGAGWPTGDGLYKPTPPNFAVPFGALAGSWKTWVLPTGDAIRPAPYPAFGSNAWRAELSAVEWATQRRTHAQEQTIDHWLARRPSGVYTFWAEDLIEREGVGEAEAAQILAMTAVAQYDALVAVWDAKYFYWTARPDTLDPELNLYIPDPPYPSYPGGFASACSSAATVLADAFPVAEAELMASAWEGASLRAWSGIHFPLDNEVGLVMGNQVGRLVVDAVRNGSSLPA